MELSDCCDATRWFETDLCSQCKEHTEFYTEFHTKFYTED